MSPHIVKFQQVTYEKDDSNKVKFTFGHDVYGKRTVRLVRNQDPCELDVEDMIELTELVQQWLDLGVVKGWREVKV